MSKLPWRIEEVDPGDILLSPGAESGCAVDIVDVDGNNVAFEVMRDDAELIVKLANDYNSTKSDDLK